MNNKTVQIGEIFLVKIWKLPTPCEVSIEVYEVANCLHAQNIERHAFL